MQVDPPIKPLLKAPGTMRLKQKYGLAPGTIRLKLKYGKLLSSFAFKSNLRRFPEGAPRKIAVSGPKGCVDAAMKMINDLLAGGRISAAGIASLVANSVAVYP